MSITVINRKSLPHSKTVEEFVKFLMKRFGIDMDREINILLTDDQEIQLLNRQFKKKDAPTNVLSFYGYDDENILGDIAISIDTLKKESEEQNRDFVEYLLFIVAHGFLHLLGYTHETMEKFEEMMTIQNILVSEYLNSKGVKQ